MIYLCLFCIVLSLIRIVEKTKIKIIQYILSILIIGLLATLAGCRDITVGIDTSLYPLETFEYCLKCTSINEILFYPIEPLYTTLAYIISRFTDNISWFLFITHLIICTLFYVSAYQHKCLYLFMFIFLFICYNISLNLSRQYLAVSVFVYSFHFLEEKKIIKYCIGICVASLFHSSAGICFLLPIIEKSEIYKKKYMRVFSISILIIILLGYRFILPPLIRVLGLPSKYLTYTDNTYEGFFSVSEFVLRICFIGLCLNMFLKQKYSSTIRFFSYIISIEFLLNLLQIYSKFINRIALYFFMLYLIYLPFILNLYSKKTKIQYQNVIYIVCIIYWAYVFFIQEAGRTIPYQSAILGIK